MITAIIPARYRSTRFPGKPLALIGGVPMIQRVYERVTNAAKVSRVYVATDDERIAQAVRDFGGDAIMTDPALPSGTDRVAAAAAELAADIIVNVQGDEPLIEPVLIDETLAPLLSDPSVAAATPVKAITTAEELHDPNVVKVVFDGAHYALYFSRAAIPHRRGVPPEQWLEGQPYWKHIGLYVYRRAALHKFAAMPPSALERAEQLEQLRFLELGGRMLCVETGYDSHAVDTPGDIATVERLIWARVPAGAR